VSTRFSRSLSSVAVTVAIARWLLIGDQVHERST
jgi:hypothetical protein